MLRLVMPKYVELKNRNLRIAFNVVQFFVIAFLVFQLSTMVTWLNRVEISNMLDEDVWVEPVDPAAVERVWNEQRKSKLCTKPEDYVFRDGSKLHTMEGHSCLPPCGIPGAPAYPNCAHHSESVMQEAAHQIMFASEYEERWYGESVDAGNASSHFTPYEEAYAIRFRYGFDVPQLSGLGEEITISGLLGRLPNIRGVSDNYDSSSNVRKILTVVVDKDDKPQQVHEPKDGPTVRLGVTEILEYSGAKDIMDKPNPLTGPNTHPDTKESSGGIHRVTGLNMDVVIQCYLTQQEELPGRTAWADPDNGRLWPVCYIKPKISGTRVHAKWDQKDRVGPNLRTRTGAGLRIRVISEGTFDFFDFNFALLQFTSSVVLLSLPRQIMFVFINFFLGHLSTIYRAVLIELFDVQTEIARMTARLMSNSVTYVELEDVDSDEDEESKNAGAISKRRVEDQLKTVLQYRGAQLDAEEMMGLVRFCNHSMLEGAQFKRPRGGAAEILHYVRSFGEAIGLVAPYDHTLSHSRSTRVRTVKSHNITIDDFSMCCAADNKLEFESFVSLFDKQRGITVLENLFLPNFLRPEVLTAKARQDPLEEAYVPPPTEGSQEFKMYNIRQRHWRTRRLLEECKLSGEDAPYRSGSKSVSKCHTLRVSGAFLEPSPSAEVRPFTNISEVYQFAKGEEEIISLSAPSAEVRPFANINGEESAPSTATPSPRAEVRPFTKGEEEMSA